MTGKAIRVWGRTRRKPAKDEAVIQNVNKKLHKSKSNGLQNMFWEVAIEDSWIPLRVVVSELTDSRRTVTDRMYETGYGRPCTVFDNQKSKRSDAD